MNRPSAGAALIRAAVLLFAGAAAPLSAQTGQPVDTIMVPSVTIAGIVRDSAGRALANAEVRARDSVVFTGRNGRFVINGLVPDTITLAVRRIGYRPVETELVAEPGLRIDVAVTMTPSAVVLGTVVIMGQAMNTRLWKAGFYERSKVGTGTFFTPEDVERHGGTFTALLRDVPSLTVTNDMQGRMMPLGRFGGGTCRMNIFLDGTLIRWAPDVGIDGIIAKRDILAIEVYPRASQLPSTLSGFSSNSPGGTAIPSPDGSKLQGQADCGAVVIWSK